MNEYIMSKKSVGHYAETRNNLIGSEYSSKLSPWLGNGSISVR
jgi:deoxyribodipyrimidine photo-lyase